MPRSLLALGTLAAALLLLAPDAARAQSSDLDGFPFLRLDPSARAAALGGSFAAVTGSDVNGLFYNPAQLNPSMDGALSVSYLNHLSDLNAGFVAYGREVQGVGTLAAGLRFLGYGDFERADENGERLGSFGAGDVALTLGGARPYGDRLRVGAAVHGIYASIDDYSATALAVDGGLLYVLPEARVGLSASIHNLGTTLSSLGDTRDRLPTDLRLGVTKRLRYLPLMVSVTGYRLHELDGSTADDASALANVMNHVVVGGEFQFSDAFNVRVGYNHRRHEQLKMKSRLDLAGVGLGVGLRVSGIYVDYAFNSWSDLGGLHQLTVRTQL